MTKVVPLRQPDEDEGLPWQTPADPAPAAPAPAGAPLRSEAMGISYDDAMAILREPVGPGTDMVRRDMAAAAIESMTLHDGSTDPDQPLPDFGGSPDEPVATDQPPFPFTLLGHDHGLYFYLGHDAKQVTVLKANAHTGLNMLQLAPLSFWSRRWPSKRGFDSDQAASDLLAIQHRLGVYDATRLRGRGAWWDKSRKAPIIHLGDRLMIDGVPRGLHEAGDKFIYECAVPIPVDMDNPLKKSEAVKLAEVCTYISWEKPLYGRLLAGWIVCASVCGALRWKPNCWVQGPASCTDGETEYLSPAGWKKIADYDGGKVAQWDDGAMSYVQPSRYIDEPCDEMLLFRNDCSISMAVTPEHRIPLYDWAGKFVVKSAQRVADKPSRHLVPVHFEPPTGGLDLSDNDIRLRVMIAADACYPKRGNQCVVTLKKDRKLTRLRWLLAECGIAYSERQHGSRPTELVFTFTRPSFPKPLHLSANWYAASRQQLSVLVDELHHWDGTFEGTNTFSTNKLPEAEIAQFAAHACGMTAHIRKDVYAKANWNPTYKVCWSNLDSQKNKVALRGDNIAVSKIVPAGGRKFCFSVPSTFWIARREGRIFVTGNSGKSTIVDHIVARSLGANRHAFVGGTTEPALRNVLKADALPIVLDDLDSKSQRGREANQQILALMRVFSSEDGGSLSKGSQSGIATSYKVHSCYIFCSIVVEADSSADKSRIAVLRLAQRKFEKGQLVELHALIARSLPDGFAPRFFARCINCIPAIRANAETFAQAIGSVTGSQRNGDVYGHLFAGAYALHADGIISPQEAAAYVGSREEVMELLVEEKQTVVENNEGERALAHLLEQVVTDSLDGRMMRASIYDLLLQSKCGNLGLEGHADYLLKRHGMKAKDGCLFVANDHTALRTLYEKSAWPTGWAGVLKALPGATAAPPMAFGGRTVRSTKIPLSALERNAQREPGSDDE